MASTATGTELTEAHPPRTVTVRIRLDKAGDVQSVEPEYFAISKKENEEVLWVIDNPEVYFTVEFKQETPSPFYESQFNTQFPFSGLVRREVLGDSLKYYKYSVTAGKKRLDPGGVVNQ